MLHVNSCRKFVIFAIGNLKEILTPMSHYMGTEQHMVVEFKTRWSARTLYVYAHADLAQKYPVGLQEIFVSRLCSQEENSFSLPC
jgi:hypothetical protein